MITPILIAVAVGAIYALGIYLAYKFPPEHPPTTELFPWI